MEVRQEAVTLVTEFADIFAVSDLDFGNSVEIEHRIEY